MNKKIILAHLMLLSANFIYGVNYTAAKMVMPQFILPLGFILARAISAVIFFWTLKFFLPKDNQKIEKKDWIRLVFCGLFGVFANQTLFFSGLELTNPISASVIMTMVPISILVLSVVMGKEKLSWRKGTGVGLGFLGAVLLVMLDDSMVRANAPNPTLGNLLIFANGVSYATYLVLAKPLLQKYSPYLVLRWIFLFGLLMVFPVGVEQFTSVTWSSFTTNAVLAFAFVLIFTSCITYLFNVSALKTLAPSSVGIYIYSQPIFAAIVAVLLGYDSLDWEKVIPTILIFIGVYLVVVKR